MSETKPQLTPAQQAQLESMLKKAGCAEIISTLRSETGLLPTECDAALAKFITEDKEMLLLKSKVKKVFNLSHPVIIRGETGTGKELIAEALHSGRKGQFKAINLTALPNELIESELFGHVRGAFTGAVETTVGMFEASENGTLFLDEIGDMPLDSQAKLLRVLQTKRIRRVGDTKELAVNCRIVCATHRDLESMIKDKLFREDLYWRLNAITLWTTPLRDRRNDIFEMFDSVLDIDGELNEEIRTQLSNFNLNGNYRELQSRVLKYKLFKEL